MQIHRLEGQLPPLRNSQPKNSDELSCRSPRWMHAATGNPATMNIVKSSNTETVTFQSSEKSAVHIFRAVGPFVQDVGSRVGRYTAHG